MHKYTDRTVYWTLASTCYLTFCLYEGVMFLHVPQLKLRVLKIYQDIYVCVCVCVCVALRTKSFHDMGSQ